MLKHLESVTGTELQQLQRRCMQLLQSDDDASRFPGAQPVSFERKHLTPPSAEGRSYVSLLQAPYYAAEKTDGVRYMLLILGAKGAFAIDRNFGMRKLPSMRFPSRTDPSVPLDGTLLDGELIIERGGTGQPVASAATSGASAGGDAASLASEPRMRFLAYDACRVGNKAVCDAPLRTRLMALRREVLTPRYQLAASDPTACAGEPFTVELKDFFHVKQLPHIFSRVETGPPDSSMLYAFDDPLRKLSHGNDGIIFTPVRDPYVGGTCPSLLKWKPTNMNSVDFRLQTKWRREGDKPEPQPRFFLGVADRGTIVPFCWITFSDKDFERFSCDPAADTRIIECVYDPTWHVVEYNTNDYEEKTWDNPEERQGGWRFERIREDKNLPNDARTVTSIQQSVKDGVTAPELLYSLGMNPSAFPNLGAFAPQPRPAQQTP